MWNLGVCESLVPQYYLRKFIPKKICYRDRPMPNKKGVRVGCPKIHCYITMFTHFPWFSPHEQCHFQAHHGPPSQIPSTTAPATKWHLALQRAPWRGVKQALLKELVQGGRATCRWSHWKKNKLTNWLVVSTPLKNMKSVGMIIPNIWENKTCSKPPTKSSNVAVLSPPASRARDQLWPQIHRTPGGNSHNPMIWSGMSLSIVKHLQIILEPMTYSYQKQHAWSTMNFNMQHPSCYGAYLDSRTRMHG